jgi:2-hydroxy-3-keto-5-methylthiopentenyl-1-phosphate phosphatase
MLFVIDFDGTLSLRDSVDALLERYAPAEWHAIEAEWAQGRITAKECMKQQIRMIEADETQLERFFETIRLDQTFLPFLNYVQSFAQVAIISDGIGRAIHTALEAAGFPGIPIFANLLSFLNGHWELDFPNSAMDCKVGSGVCKCAVARDLAGSSAQPVVLIGDGRSDMCLAGRADYVFAKESLARYCESQSIPFSEFTNFRDVLHSIQSWPVMHGTPNLVDVPNQSKLTGVAR